MIDERHLVCCDCGDTKEHLIDFQFHGDCWDDSVFVSAALNHYLPWYRRIKPAFKYLFGIDNTHCHYVETVINKKAATDLRDWLDKIIPKMS